MARSSSLKSNSSVLLRPLSDLLQLIQFDENSDGTIDAKDLEGVITGLVAEEASVKRFRTLAMFSVFLMFFILCANAGMAVAVAYLSKVSHAAGENIISVFFLWHCDICHWLRATVVLAALMHDVASSRAIVRLFWI